MRVNSGDVVAFLTGSVGASLADMASKTITLLEDDIDGGEASQTIRFAYQGVEWEIDLSDKNAAKLEKALEPFMGAGRRVGGRRRGTSVKSNAKAMDAAAIREWAQGAGYEVSARGRVSAAVREAYEAAH
jgi:hypothetical protein